jgi:di/tricarboxylate transporter
MDGDLLEPTAQRNRHWRSWILRAIGVALVLKLIALLVIKSAFFPAANEPEITPRLVDDHLAVEATPSQLPATETPP